MSHRRPDPRHAGLEQALRHALRLAVDSIEPGSDGLDRIRAKIAARPRVGTGWQNTYRVGLRAVLSILWRFGEPAVIWLRYWTGAIAERFRPDLGRVGWLGWLRPVAAVATVLLVATGASWAATALPSMISSAGESQNYGGGQGSQGNTPGSAHHSSQAGGGTGSSNPARSSAHVSPNCRTNSAAPSGSASSRPTQSSNPSPSSSSSPSSSPAPSSSSSTSASGSPSPSGSPSSSTTNSPASVQAAQSALAAGVQAGAAGAGHLSVAAQTRSTPPATAKPSPGSSSRRPPCT
jgi:hypothetical protein